jgi:germination protein M
MEDNMSRRIIVVFLSVILLAISAGCRQPQQQAPEQTTSKIKVFYGDSNNEKMVTEERSISYQSDEDKYALALKELIKGPENADYTANIKPETKVYGVIRQNGDMIVDMSEDFAQFAGSVAEIIAVGSVVNTLTQFDGIERVKILVEGEELIGPSGEPRGFMGPFPTDPNISDNTGKIQVTLYFSDDQAMGVVGEQRQIEAAEDRQQFIKLVLEELIKGPRSEKLYATIPKTVKVQSVKIQDGIAAVDFSQQMHIDHWGGATGEAMTIDSIVNTLTEFDYIEKVKMTVDGQPMSIEHAILEEPVGRNEDAILK